MGFPGDSVGKKKLHLQCKRPWFNSWVRKTPWRRDRLPTHSSILGLAWWFWQYRIPCNVGVLGSIPGLGRSPGRGHGNPLQYPCLENPHGQRILAGYSPWVAKSRTRLSN